VLVLLAGGVGTFLAAIGFQLWVAFTTALATAFTTYLQYRQTENTLTQYNQTATNLQNVKGWWVALSAEDQADPKKIQKLVETTEDVLASEQTGWVQQMQDALAKLRQDQTKAIEPQKGTETKEPTATGERDIAGQPQAQPKPAATPTAKPPQAPTSSVDTANAETPATNAAGESDNQN
jgi:hypothetical protein